MKKKGIRILSTVIAGIVTATSVPWGMTGVFAETANEAETSEIGGRYYITGGFVVIEGYEGESSELVIPSEIDGKPVREIGYSAFSGHEDIKSIQIPESVERIGHNAFSDCTSLETLALPAGVTVIADSLTNLRVRESKNRQIIKSGRIQQTKLKGTHYSDRNISNKPKKRTKYEIWGLKIEQAVV